jgi:tetratricopeptide (TPR) repeat protein
MQKRPAVDLQTLFLQGDHRSVIAELDRDPSLMKKPQNLVVGIGAYVFTGEQEKAEILYARASAVSPSVHAACRFFLGLGQTRLSRYDRARERFALNARTARKTKSDLLGFYAHQGLGFYRFFCGRYQLALWHARRAYECAVRRGFRFGEILSLDLLGHASVSAGEIRLGLKHLGAALELAESVGNRSVAAALRISIVKFRAQYGLSPKTAIASLHNALRELHVDDTYSKAELYLELSRQLLLRGDLDGSRKILNESCDLIYPNRNRRQAATLNLRFSYLMHLEGQNHQALHLLRVAETSLVPDVDRLHFAQLRGLQARIENVLGRKEAAEQLQLGARHETQALVHSVHARIVSRTDGKETRQRAGEDPLGDLVDQVHRGDERCLEPLLDAGFFGLLPQYLSHPIEARVVIFDLVPGSLTLTHRGNVRFHPKGINGQLRKLARALLTAAKKRASKEDLIRNVWGYDYDPARHDSLVYAAVTKLRKLLDPYGSWLEYNEEGYAWGAGVEVRFLGAPISGQIPATSSPQAAMTPTSDPMPDRSHAELSGLNYRQILILETMAERRVLAVADCSRLLQVSKITASRDLALLTDLGHCKRLGHGRATSYVLASKPGESR